TCWPVLCQFFLQPLLQTQSESKFFPFVIDISLLLFQVYEENDYRRVRFVGRQKEVNENFAIDLIAEQQVNEVESRVIFCDGGGGALGHPKVYINLDKDTKTGTCGYCGLQYKQKHHH
uniref:NADH dehydrogenase [ubiquinone] iron-sulfur protein 6, mitochondrial n=1 Tax=Varanus komodoensis TaxID=61221 RepID=A0A8D2J2K9_VARKO